MCPRCNYHTFINSWNHAGKNSQCTRCGFEFNVEFSAPMNSPFSPPKVMGGNEHGIVCESPYNCNERFLVPIDQVTITDESPHFQIRAVHGWDEKDAKNLGGWGSPSISGHALFAEHDTKPRDIYWGPDSESIKTIPRDEWEKRVEASRSAAEFSGITYEEFLQALDRSEDFPKLDEPQLYFVIDVFMY